MPTKIRDEVPVPEMLSWIAARYQMSTGALARMFQTSPSTIRTWLKNGNITWHNYRKIRASYFYLNNSKDPHASQRKCQDCQKWLAPEAFRNGKSICRNCER